MGKTAAGQTALAPYVPGSAETIEFLKANAVYARTERFDYLDRREAHWRGLQYDHLKYDWWGLSADQTETISPRVSLPAGFEYASPQADMPVRMKRPTAPLNLCMAIIRRFTGMLFSEQRTPRIKAADDLATEDWIRTVAKEAQFWTAMKSGRNLGGALGSVLMTVHVREGRFSYEVHNTKNLTVIWKDRRTWTPLGVLKMYTHPQQVEVRDEKGKRVLKEVEMLYRRIITAEDDIVFQEVQLEDGVEPSWEPDPQLSVHHGLGFFPGRWIQNEVDSEDPDGDADCEGAWQMLDTMDRMGSQVNKGTLANLDPTLWTAIDERAAALGGGPIRKGSENALDLGKEGRAGYLEMTGAGIEVALKVLAYWEKKVLALAQCVMLDPGEIGAVTTSAKGMEYVFGPMIERADGFRGQYGAAARDLLNMTIEIGRRFEGQAVAIGKNEATGETEHGVFGFDLPPKVENGKAVPRRLGPGGTIELVWGPYFAPTEQDEAQRVTNAVAAKNGGVVSREVATRHVAPVFDIDDPAQAAQAAAGEAAEETERALAGLDGGVGAFGPRDQQTPPGGQGGRP